MTQVQAGDSAEVGAIISAAATCYWKGDKVGATEAAASLLATYPTDRRVVLTCMALGALTGDGKMTHRAVRILQASHIICIFCSSFRAAVRRKQVEFVVGDIKR